MISEVLENTKAKYVEKLEEAIAKRDEQINAKCDELRATLLAEPNAEIESLEKVISDLDALIAKEKAEEIASKQEVVEEKVEEVAQEEPIVEEKVEEPIVEQEVVKEPIQEEQPKVEVKEVEIKTNSLIRKIKELKKEKEEQEQQEVVEEQPQTFSQKIVKISKQPQGRAGMAGIFNPKRR